jgi:hypothetical protein
MVDSYVGVEEPASPTKKMATQQITRGADDVEIEEIALYALPSYDTATHTSAAVTTSDTTPVAANADRKYLLLVNDSDATIYLAIGATAVASAGIPLGVGVAYEMSSPFGNLTTGAIHAIHASTGSKTMLVTEGT